jgi:hypothetical protein
MIITHNTIKAGDRVIVLGASGGVGTASRLTGDQLHNQKVAAVGFFNSINRSNVGMIQRRQHPRFALEPLYTFGIVAKHFRQKLDGNTAAQLRIGGLIHVTHSA